jgi:nitroreductase
MEVSMELDEVMQTSGTCRFYKPDPIPDAVLARVLDAARFAPNGGNRQGLRFIVVTDAAKKAQLAEWYRAPWKAYMEGARAGQIDVGGAWKVVENADHFADHLQDVPAIIVVCAKMDAIHPTDHELGRLSVVGGGSIYPGVQNLLLRARQEGLGTALTTLLCIFEPQVREMLGIPEDVITAAHVAIGWPERPFPKKLSRMPLAEMVHLNSWGTALPGA